MPSIPADNSDGRHLPRKGCDPGLELGLDVLNLPAACSAFVNAVCKAVGFKYSCIWEFSATASSNLLRSSFIWEAWVLIFLSFLICLERGLVTTGSPSDSVSIEVAFMAFTDAFAAASCRVPRTLDNSLQNSVKDIFGICLGSILAIDMHCSCQKVDLRIAASMSCPNPDGSRAFGS